MKKSSGAQRAPGKKRMGKEDSPARMKFIRATERLMQRDGYGSVIARKVAEEAGLKKQLLYYYFESLDELIVEVFDRFVSDFVLEVERAFLQENSLQVLWNLYTSGDAILLTEFVAMSNHNDAIRGRIFEVNARCDEIICEGFKVLLDDMQIDQSICPPEVALFLFTATTQKVLMHRDLGYQECKEPLNRFVEWLFNFVSASQEKTVKK